MPLQNFIDNSLPTIKAAWLNSIDAFYTTLFQSATTPAQARAALDVPAVGDVPTEANIQDQTFVGFTTGGTGSAYTLTPVPAATSYAAQQRWSVKFSATSLADPTITINGLASPPNLVKKTAVGTYTNIQAGDIITDMFSDVVLISPTQALVVSPVNNQQAGGGSRTLTAVTAASALTITMPPTVISFRSGTVGSGAVTVLESLVDTTLVVPSGATLGTTSGVESELVILAINNAGTIELAVANISGGVNLDGMGVITTTTIGTGSDSATGLYSTTGRSNVAYQVVGYIRSTQATAGTWATNPSLIQGIGGSGNSLMQGMGYGQSWQAITITNGVSYTNGPRPIMIASTTTVSGTLAVNVNGMAVAVITNPPGSAASLFVIIPPYAGYNTSGSGDGTWTALM